MIIGIGTDLIEVARLEKSVNKPAFLKKVFTDKELELCEKKQSRLQSLAARFAAKEACMKALGTGWAKGVCFYEIEILNDEKGTPRINLLGKTRDLAEKLGVQNISISLSHIKNIATATVILEK
ncbi:MAG: holo-ACP synthase [Candidatus Cloacimonetes bacterium]|nr:holo-ACP synthase [Candidatus Cloacimonadota bacterium]